MGSPAEAVPYVISGLIDIDGSDPKRYSINLSVNDEVHRYFWDSATLTKDLGDDTLTPLGANSYAFSWLQDLDSSFLASLELSQFLLSTESNGQVYWSGPLVDASDTTTGPGDTDTSALRFFPLSASPITYSGGGIDPFTLSVNLAQSAGDAPELHPACAAIPFTLALGLLLSQRRRSA